MRKAFLVFWIFIGVVSSFAQNTTKRVLFIGNSYTNYNNLPLLVKDVALSTGDTIIFDSHMPGGFTLQGHSSDATTLSKIAQGNWDFVVLQEQSQRPSFSQSQVETEVFPFAKRLDSLVKVSNKCAETIFYMTWGRKNGDASNCAAWPPICTYQGMDSLLQLRYQQMADDNGGIVSPVGPLWRYLRNNNPSIELYNPDQSHPSLEGSYAAACSFYATILRKNPDSITFNSSLSIANATAIRNAAKLVVYDSLTKWNVGKYDPVALFSSSSLSPNRFSFTNLSQNADFYSWQFGDGTSDTSSNPSHSYTTNGSYTITLIAEKCFKKDSFQQVVNVNINNISDPVLHPFYIYPNPVYNKLMIYLPSISNNESLDIRILDINGRESYHNKFSISDQSSIEVDLSILSIGMYIIELKSDRVKPTKLKLVKQNKP